MKRFLMLVMPLLLLSGMLSGCVVPPWHDADERGGYQDRRHDRYRDEEQHHENDRRYGYHDDDRYRDRGGGYRYDGNYAEQHR